MTAAPSADAAGAMAAGPAGGGNTDSAYCDAGLIVAAVMGPADTFFDDAVRLFRAAKSSGARPIMASLGPSEAA